MCFVFIISHIREGQVCPSYMLRLSDVARTPGGGGLVHFSRG